MVYQVHTVQAFKNLKALNVCIKYRLSDISFANKSDYMWISMDHMPTVDISTVIGCLTRRTLPVPAK